MKQGKFTSIQKAWSVIKGSRCAFSIVEVLLSAAIFSLAISAFVGTMLYGQESAALSGKRSRAVMLADEGIEAARSIRNNSFDNLTDGDHGLEISSNQWIFSGTSDVIGEFTRTVNISTIDDSRRQVQSTVLWQQNIQRSGSVSVSTYLTDWNSASSEPEPAIETCAQYCASVGYSDGTCRNNSGQCDSNGETYESGGDGYCTGGPSADTCCCAP